MHNLFDCIANGLFVMFFYAIYEFGSKTRIMHLTKDKTTNQILSILAYFYAFLIGFLPFWVWGYTLELYLCFLVKYPGKCLTEPYVWAPSHN